VLERAARGARLRVARRVPGKRRTPELVGDAGVPFDSPEDVPDALVHLASDLDGYRARISIPTLASVADAYLAVLGLAGEARP
jgi:hypothetical protein